MRPTHLLVFACLAVACRRKEVEPLRVAAASDLARAFPELGAELERSTGKEVTFTFGSTGLLAKQLTEGAPFRVFAAANVSFVDDVVRSGACFGDTRAFYARGRLVVFTRVGAPAPKELADLAQPEYAKIAIANPEHAPYGKAARQALQRAGQWTTVESRVVLGENVQQAYDFARTGNADAAIVSLSLTIGAAGSTLALSDTLHDPIDQALVVCGQGAPDEDARRFVDLVASPTGRGVMRKYGFLLPGETVAAP